MRRLAALLTVFTIPAAFGYTADELAAKNVEAKGRKDRENLSADDAKGLGEDAADFAGALVDYKAALTVPAPTAFNDEAGRGTAGGVPSGRIDPDARAGSQLPRNLRLWN